MPGPRCTTSRRVMRPPSPGPGDRVRVQPRSAIRRRTTGDVDPPVRGRAGRAGRRGPGGAGAGVGCRGRSRRGGGDAGATWATGSVPAAGSGAGAGGAGAGRHGPSLRRVTSHARRAPTSTVSPSGTMISVRTPAAAQHLGVDLVGRDLEQRLVQCDGVPTCLSHPRDRSSVTVSPAAHRDVHSGESSCQPCSDRPVSASADSPNSSLRVGGMDQRAQIVRGCFPVHREYPSANSSVAHGPAMCTPSSGPSRSATIFTSRRAHHDDGTTVADEPMHRRDDVVATLDRHGLRESAERDLGVAVDAHGNLVVIDRDDVSPRILLTTRSPRRSRHGPARSLHHVRPPRRRPAPPSPGTRRRRSNLARRPPHPMPRARMPSGARTPAHAHDNDIHLHRLRRVPREVAHRRAPGRDPRLRSRSRSRP